MANSQRGIPSRKNSPFEEIMVNSCQNKLVAVTGRATNASHKRSHHPQPQLPLPRLAAQSCGPRAL
jgi:hypothetical protein